nr:MAG TPA: hypothetical protein [Caudoviricetes sp.]
MIVNHNSQFFAKNTAFFSLISDKLRNLTLLFHIFSLFLFRISFKTF